MRAGVILGWNNFGRNFLTHLRPLRSEIWGGSCLVSCFVKCSCCERVLGGGRINWVGKGLGQDSSTGGHLPSSTVFAKYHKFCMSSFACTSCICFMFEVQLHSSFNCPQPTTFRVRFRTARIINLASNSPKFVARPPTPDYR